MNFPQEIVMPALNLLKNWIVPATLVLALGACAGDATTRSTGRYIDDASITAAVKTKLIGDETVKARNINVGTYNGVVQLTGFVESRTEATQAIALAEQVEGVRSVKDDLRLRQ
jgi:hyperosmotically inducible protein